MWPWRKPAVTMCVRRRAEFSPSVGRYQASWTLVARLAQAPDVFTLGVVRGRDHLGFAFEQVVNVMASIHDCKVCNFCESDF